MKTINFNIDTSPYIPDIFLKDDVYKSSDNVDYNTTVSINKMIFIFNISKNYDQSIYNDPGYLLYGITKFGVTYLFPSTFFFNTTVSFNSINVIQYSIIESSTELTNELKDLLTKIGYNTTNIDTTTFYYALISCYDRTSTGNTQVLYFYFTVNNLTQINYNNYNSTVYYENNYWNTFIYPFITTTDVILGIDRNINVSYDAKNYLSDSKNNIDNFDFNNCDLIKYLEKIDYKYMERTSVLENPNDKIKLLSYYTKNIKNFNEYINSQNDSLMINLNEINKLYYNNIDYENKYLNSYTSTILNNHINKNITSCNNDKKYSFTMDNKFSNTKKLLKNKYSCYNYEIINIPSIYQLTKNYFINSYIDITKEKYNDENNSLLFVTNSYLYRILLSIDPNIIKRTYVFSANLSISITDLFQNNNKLKFGSGLDKINLYFIDNFRFTNTYYNNKYKIVYSITLTDGSILYYDIILSIIFFNGNNINILYPETTFNTNVLGFITYTNQDSSVTLSPVLYNQNKQIKIYENMLYQSLYDVKNYSLIINYDNITNYKNYFNNYFTNHFYFFISNFIPNLIEYSKENDKTFISNLFNININKVNNLVKNIININKNINNCKHNIQDKISLLITSIVHDTNITSSLIYDYPYFPIINLESYLPTTINKYKIKNYYVTNSNNNTIYNDNLVSIPAGNYKVFNYTNFNPLNTLLTSTTVNDNIIKTINTIDDFFNNNCCIMIKIPDNINIDDKFYVDNYTNNFYNQDNYTDNIGFNNTLIFLVVCNSNNQIYVTTENIIYGLQLFNTFNDYTNKNTGNKYKIKLNLLINSYLNFYQMNIFTEIYNNYSEKNNVVQNINKLYLNLYPTTYLKEIVFYDFYRFNYILTVDDILSQYNSFDINIANYFYWNKYYLNQIKLNLKQTIFICDSIKNLISVTKCLTYLNLIKYNILLYNFNNEYYIDLVKLNIDLSSIINYFNYDLNITYSTSNYIIQDFITNISLININTTLDEIVKFIEYSTYIINYIKTKIDLVNSDLLQNITNLNNIDTSLINYTLSTINTDINNFNNNNQIKLKLFYFVETQINNIFINININSIQSSFTNLSDYQIQIILNTIINYLFVILLNSNKINELYNLLNLIYYNQTYDIINYDGIYTYIIKNTYIYDTTYYNNVLQITNFNYFNFLDDMKTTILYFSNPVNSSTDASIIYVKSMNDGIIDYINNVINYFSLINDQIIGIYKYVNNITLGTIAQINIYDNENISNLYFLLTNFKQNYEALANIVISNHINIFQEFNPMIDFFTKYYSDINEYLLYIQLINDITNLNSSSTIISQDILNILGIDEIYSLVTTLLNNITNLYTKSDSDTIIYYLQLINVSSTFTNVNLPSSDIVIYSDYNILQEFNPTLFNFNSTLLNIITDINTINYTIFNYYYQDGYQFYKQFINYNFINNQLIYVNIDNVN